MYVLVGINYGTMMKDVRVKSKIIIISCCIAILCGMLAAENCFVEKKKPDSSSQLREKCGDCVIDVLRGTPRKAKSIAQQQELSMEIFEKIHEGSFLENATKAELSAHYEECKAYVSRDDQINALSKQQTDFLIAQAKKSSAKKVK